MVYKGKKLCKHFLWSCHKDYSCCKSCFWALCISLAIVTWRWPKMGFPHMADVQLLWPPLHCLHLCRKGKAFIKLFLLAGLKRSLIWVCLMTVAGAKTGALTTCAAGNSEFRVWCKFHFSVSFWPSSEYLSMSVFLCLDCGWHDQGTGLGFWSGRPRDEKHESRCCYLPSWTLLDSSSGKSPSFVLNTLSI